MNTGFIQFVFFGVPKKKGTRSKKLFQDKGGYSAYKLKRALSGHGNGGIVKRRFNRYF